jgi:hypothetical protein
VIPLAQQLRIELRKRKEPLLPELWPFVQEDRLHHPFVITDIDPDYAALVNSRYRSVKAAAESAKENGNWSTYINLHERPYRPDALAKCVALGLSDSGYWRLVGEVWTDSENIHQCLKRWRKLWSSNKLGRDSCMDEKERAALADLPDCFGVWRGTAHQQSVKGLSWTTDKEKAEWFARRFAIATQPLLVRGTVAKKDVIGLHPVRMTPA